MEATAAAWSGVAGSHTHSRRELLAEHSCSHIKTVKALSIQGFDVNGQVFSWAESNKSHRTAIINSLFSSLD